MAGSLCVRGRPAQAKRNRPAVVLALDWILFTTKIKSKNLVVQIEQGNYRLSSMRAGDAVAGLRVHLRMRIKILVADRNIYTPRCVVEVLIRLDGHIGFRQPLELEHR